MADKARKGDSEGVEAMEGDESELEVGRHADVGRALLATPVREIMRRTVPVTVAPDVTVARALDLMVKKRVSAVMVVDKRAPRRLVGIFTERDWLLRSRDTRAPGRQAVRKVMTPSPETLKVTDGVAYALNKMSVGRFRHVPVVDGRGVPVGMVTTRDLVDFIVELCPEEVLNLPSQPGLALHREREGA